MLILEADYMEIFIPGWNSSWIDRAEILSRPSDKISEKRSSWLHKENFDPDWNVSPVWASRAENFMPVDRAGKFHVIARKNFSPAEKMIDRRGKIQIAKTTEATDKFLPGITFDLRFIPG